MVVKLRYPRNSCKYSEFISSCFLKENLIDPTYIQKQKDGSNQVKNEIQRLQIILFHCENLNNDVKYKKEKSCDHQQVNNEVCLNRKK